MNSRRAGLLALAGVASSAALAPAQVDRNLLTGGLLVTDTGLNSVWLCRDLNSDGDYEDANERALFLDSTNLSGFPSAGAAVQCVLQMPCFLVLGENNSDSLYVVADLNGDGDALDTGEVLLGFQSLTNPGGLLMQAPTGLASDGDAVYVVTAGSNPTANSDAVFRLVDDNDDNDAMDAGESSRWCDLGALIASSSPFEIAFDGDTAFVADSRGSLSDVILRARDANADGVVDVSEISVYYDSASGLGPTAGFAVVADGASIIIADSSPVTNPQRLFRLTDLDASNTINAANEVRELWNETLVPSGFALGTIFSVALGPAGSIAVASSGADNADNVFLLRDTNSDGDYLNPGETTIALAGHGAGVFPETIRAVRFVLPPGAATDCGPACDPDFTCDGNTDQDDVAALVTAIASGDYSTLCLDPDFNLDGNADQDDISSVINVIAGGGCP